MGWRRKFKKQQSRRAPGELPQRLKWRPRLRIFGLISGAIGGIGSVVLVQQYGIAPLSGRLSMQGLVGGISSGILVPSAIWAVVVLIYNRKLGKIAAQMGIPTKHLPSPRTVVLFLLPMAFTVVAQLLAPPASAELDGRCDAVVNGRDVRGMAVHNDDALKLTRQDSLVLTMSAPQTVTKAEIGVRYAGRVFIIAQGEDDEPGDDLGEGGSLTVEFAVDDVAFLGGGLYEFYGMGTLADGSTCTGAFLFDVDVDPLETLMGMAAAGATAIGAAGLIGMSTSGILEGARYVRDLQSVVVDLDGDGIADATAFDHDQDGTLDTFGMDTDGDGLIDQVAWDSDGDGVIDRTSTATGEDAGVPSDSFDEGAPPPPPPPAMEDLGSDPSPEVPNSDGTEEGELPSDEPGPGGTNEAELPPDEPGPGGTEEAELPLGPDDGGGEPPALPPPVEPSPPPPGGAGGGMVVDPEAPAPEATDTSPQPGSDTDPEFTTEPRSPDQVWQDALDKLNGANNVRETVLDPSEYLEWLERFEAANPDATPQQIITALHVDKYPEDAFANFPEPLEDVPLFEWGPQNEGWEEVRDSLDKFTRFSPQFIDNGDQRIDIAHIYAGPRGGMGRTGAANQAGAMANTHAGDLYQVVFDDRGWALFPPDQYNGNNIGLVLNEFYTQPGNESVPLSQAMRRVLRGGTFVEQSDLPSVPPPQDFPPGVTEF